MTTINDKTNKVLNDLGYAEASFKTLLAGERNVDSATASYIVVRNECNITRLDIDTTETLVTSAPCHVLAVIGNEGNTGYTDLIDASVTASGNTPQIRCDVAAGSSLNLHASRFENGLSVDGESAGHDVSILWRPI